MPQTIIGVIGGTGLYELDCLEQTKTFAVDTPFGPPSSLITSGRIGEAQLLFIARHGSAHSLLPSEINYRANIYALKSLGAQWCVSISAAGSLVEEFPMGSFVVPDQFIDRTKNRESTFFGKGICAHVLFANPVCPVLQNQVFLAARQIAGEKRVHASGTYVCMEGPAFSTRAESLLYRGIGGQLIGMTALPEAKLAREAEMAYAILALITDADCWKSADADIDLPALFEVLRGQVALSKEVIKVLATALPLQRPSTLAANALEHAIVTSPEKIPPTVRRDLAPIIGGRLPPEPTVVPALPISEE